MKCLAFLTLRKLTDFKETPVKFLSEFSITKMDLVQILSSMSYEVPIAAILSLDTKTEKTAGEIYADLVEGEKWTPDPATFSKLLDKIASMGVVEKRKITLKDPVNVIAAYKLTDQRYSIAAAALLEWGLDHKKSMIEYLGNARYNDNTRSPLGIRLSVIQLLNQGEASVKDLAEIISNIEEKNIGTNLVAKNIEELVKAGLVQRPEYKLGENIYQFSGDLSKYFEEQLPAAVQGAIAFCRSRKAFTAEDVALGSRIENIEILLDQMVEKEILTLETLDDGQDYFSLNHEAVPKGDSIDYWLLENLVQIMPLSNADKKLFRLYQAGFSSEGHDTFTRSLLRSTCEQGTDVRQLISRLERLGYAKKIFTCRQDNYYSLTVDGKDFCDNVIYPIRSMFLNATAELKTKEPLTRYWIQEKREYIRSIGKKGLIIGLQLYKPHSPHYKKKPIEERAAEFMALLSVDGTSKYDIMPQLEIKPRTMQTVVRHLMAEGSITKKRSWRDVFYFPTESGLAKYS